MSEFHFDGHPEIPTVPLPQGAHDIQATVDGDGASITYETAQGAADLVYFFDAPSFGWQGEFMTTTGVVELSNPDGTFGTEGSYYQDVRGESDTPVNADDFVFPDFSQAATGAPLAEVTALSASLMVLGAIDHLFVA